MGRPCRRLTLSVPRPCTIVGRALSRAPSGWPVRTCQRARPDVRSHTSAMSSQAVGDVIARGQNDYRARAELSSCAVRAVIPHERSECRDPLSPAPSSPPIQRSRPSRHSRCTRGQPMSHLARTSRTSCRTTPSIVPPVAARDVTGGPTSFDAVEHRRARRLAIASNLTPSSCEITRPVTAGRSL
jgi:hypothetical protein